jgi:predicted ATPase
MLTSLVVDNFRCFQNVEFRPRVLHAVIGPNGTGKSSLFDVLKLIRSLVCDSVQVLDVVPTKSLTRWDQRDEQTFVIEAELDGDKYKYQFAVRHDPVRYLARLETERLSVNDQPRFSANLGEAQLYRDNGTAGPTVKLDWTRAGISLVAESPDNRQLTRFREWLKKMTFVGIAPSMIQGRSESESGVLGDYCVNFADWYRNLSQSSPAVVADSIDQLKEVIPGFRQIRLVGNVDRLRTCQVSFRDGNAGRGREYACDFGELSEGQKCLIVLYTVLYSMSEDPRTVLFDEPDNYVAAAEIQPFLSQLQAILDDGGSQAIIASHHPEIIDALGATQASWIDRPTGYQSKISDLEYDRTLGLPISEIVSRGWNNE